MEITFTDQELNALQHCIRRNIRRNKKIMRRRVNRIRRFMERHLEGPLQIGAYIAVIVGFILIVGTVGVMEDSITIEHWMLRNQAIGLLLLGIGVGLTHLWEG